MVTGQPVMGRVFGISGGNLVANSTFFQIIGFDETKLPVLGFEFYTTPVVAVSYTADASGNYQIGIPVPNDPSLCNFKAYSQMLYLDSGAPNGIGGQSPGITWNIGTH